MSRIPNSAIPHAWADDSEHAKEVRAARGEGRSKSGRRLKTAAMAGLALVAVGLVGGLVSGRLRSA